MLKVPQKESSARPHDCEFNILLLCQLVGQTQSLLASSYNNGLLTTNSSDVNAGRQKLAFGVTAFGIRHSRSVFAFKQFIERNKKSKAWLK